MAVTHSAISLLLLETYMLWPHDMLGRMQNFRQFTWSSNHFILLCSHHFPRVCLPLWFSVPQKVKEKAPLAEGSLNICAFPECPPSTLVSLRPLWWSISITILPFCHGLINKNKRKGNLKNANSYTLLYQSQQTCNCCPIVINVSKCYLNTWTYFVEECSYALVLNP